MDAFEVGAMPVSVEQYLAFVLHPQGYRNPEWWSESDFKLFNGESRHWPASWTVQVCQCIRASTKSHAVLVIIHGCESRVEHPCCSTCTRLVS